MKKIHTLTESDLERIVKTVLENFNPSEYEDEDFIESPISGRRLVMANYQDITIYTLFNYFIQMYETESNVMILTKIHELLKDKETKPVLYTYDSILFEVKNQELDYLLERVIPQSIDLDKFPIKIKQGRSYKNLQV